MKNTECNFENLLLSIYNKNTIYEIEILNMYQYVLIDTAVFLKLIDKNNILDGLYVDNDKFVFDEMRYESTIKNTLLKLLKEIKKEDKDLACLIEKFRKCYHFSLDTKEVINEEIIDKLLFTNESKPIDNELIIKFRCIKWIKEWVEFFNQYKVWLEYTESLKPDEKENSFKERHNTDWWSKFDKLTSI
ncbi:MAG: hypothetical protein NTW85_01165 [Methylococcales bacterium]|nr:hypothetical protein [Methylococcales bacterium]